MSRLANSRFAIALALAVAACVPADPSAPTQSTLRSPAVPPPAGGEAGTPLLDLLLVQPEDVHFRGVRRVELGPEEAARVHREEVACDGQGRFHFDDLIPGGRYKVKLCKPSKKMFKAYPRSSKVQPSGADVAGRPNHHSEVNWRSARAPRFELGLRTFSCRRVSGYPVVKWTEGANLPRPRTARDKLLARFHPQRFLLRCKYLPRCSRNVENTT